MSADSVPKIGPPSAPIPAQPDTEAEVNALILDYLTCLAIDRVLSFTMHRSSETSESLDWMVRPVQGFQHLHFPDSARDVPGEDLQLKLKILDLADGIRTYTTPTAGRRPLVDLALDFMNLCSFAVAKVSKTRWFEIGAICTRLAVADYQIQTNDDDGHPPEGLLKLCSWAPDDPGLSSRWTDVQWKFVDKPPTAGGIPTVSSPVPQLTGSDLLMMMGEFLYDLMMTLDEPILIQLERGRLRDLTREETNSLLERVGMTMRSTR